jgi:hypothetical protein
MMKIDKVLVILFVPMCGTSEVFGRCWKEKDTPQQFSTQW